MTRTFRQFRIFRPRFILSIEAELSEDQFFNSRNSTVTRDASILVTTPDTCQNVWINCTLTIGSSLCRFFNLNLCRNSFAMPRFYTLTVSFARRKNKEEEDPGHGAATTHNSFHERACRVENSCFSMAGRVSIIR